MVSSLPLSFLSWGPIDSFGSNSLLHCKFLRSFLGQVFKVPEHEEDLRSVPTTHHIQSCGTSLCASFKWPSESLGDLFEATCLVNAYLDVETFSTLCRYVTISRILSVPGKRMRPVLRAFLRGKAGGSLRKSQSHPRRYWEVKDASGLRMDNQVTS